MGGVARILIVAGSDSGGGAGIQADIKTATMLGGFAMTAITAVTVQNTVGVTGIVNLPPDVVVAQMDAVIGDIGVDAIKIGMIGSAATAQAVADRLATLRHVPIVFDPVMVATSGSILADAPTVAAFRRLMELATVTTPNIPELEALSGATVSGAEAAGRAARRLMVAHGCAILAKGGHLGTVDSVVDILVPTRGDAVSWKQNRIETRHTHGTGCTLATGIACGLGQGLPLADAITRARAYVRAALMAAPGFGAGDGPIGHGLGRSPADEAR
jgi:hydroxymethylpyrimidine/phosphomethylpyrimidine kinase